MKLIESLETKASELHCDGDMDGSGLLASAASALRAAEKLNNLLECYRHSLPIVLCDTEEQWLATQEGKNVVAALKAWNEATK